MFKIGLELFLLEQAYPEELAQILRVTEKRLQRLEKELPKFKEKFKERMGAGKKLKDDERRYLSLAFAPGTCCHLPLPGCFEISHQEIVKRLVEYLHPPPEKPATEENSQGRQQKSTRKNPSRP